MTLPLKNVGQLWQKLQNTNRRMTETKLSPTNSEMAALLFPHVTTTPEEIEKRFPLRQLPPKAMVTRFAPSPTGFVHIGGIFASLISKRLAEQSGGIFYLRIEDTDQKREVENGIEGIITVMNEFGVPPIEGVVSMGKEVGEYGPYIQSHRKDIYDVYAKWMVAHGFAYPCFCTEAELEEIAQEQKRKEIAKKGYYGPWAKHRNVSLAEVKENLAAGKGFVIRVKAPENPSPALFDDLIRGHMEMDGNFVDTVLIKSTGLPTYHFAHVVDDHLMRTTHVTRGEEWLSSAPLHVQLFEMLGFKTPIYLHFSHIGKKEGNSVRKLSKRKDDEAAMSTYSKMGYTATAVIEYLLNLINPNFNDWRRQNPDAPNTEFKVDAKKIGKNIALFDLKKLNNFSQDLIAKMTAQQVYDHMIAWSEKYDVELHDLLVADPEYSVALFNIERQQVQPRKDFQNWESVRSNIWYFFDVLFAAKPKESFAFPEHLQQTDLAAFFAKFSTLLDKKLSKEEWMGECRVMASELGFAGDLKSFKEAPQSYKGHVGDLMTALRIAITGEVRTPDLYQIVEVMGKERVLKRLSVFH